MWRVRWAKEIPIGFRAIGDTDENLSLLKTYLITSAVIRDRDGAAHELDDVGALYWRSDTVHEWLGPDYADP
jgi:hypothetical protein